jgi:hypothetical protein
MILIGSRAASLRLGAAFWRQPLDFDFVCTREEYQQWMEQNRDKVHPEEVYPECDGKKMIVKGAKHADGSQTIIEFEFIEPGTSNELLADLVAKDPETIDAGAFGKVPTLDLLFTIKDSHKYKKFHLSPKIFWKTAQDWHSMTRIGARVRPEYQEFLKLREKETYTYAHPKLNQSKETFFKDDGIQYVHDHDSIHRAVAIYEHPAYTYYQKDGEEVQTSKAKFYGVSRDIQLAGVMEEAAVLAVERSLVPHPGTWTPDYAWKFGLAKISSSITSGWFRAFAYLNIPEVIKMYPQYSYWDKFQAGLANGVVKPFTGSKY